MFERLKLKHSRPPRWPITFSARELLIQLLELRSIAWSANREHAAGTKCELHRRTAGAKELHEAAGSSLLHWLIWRTPKEHEEAAPAWCRNAFEDGIVRRDCHR